MKRRRTSRTLRWTALSAIVLFGLTVVAAVQRERKIRLYDDCDAATFNAVLGDGACVGNGRTTFDEFIAELEETQDAHAWRNQPKEMKVAVGLSTTIENRGGEVHTFTPVANFGGGFVNELNGISGNPVPAPECLNFAAMVFIPAGGVEEGPTAGSAQLPVGTHRFQCCIHPWMRTVLQVLGNSAQAAPSKPTAAHHAHH